MPRVFEAFEVMDSVEALSDWGDYVKELIAFNISGRLITSGVSLLATHGQTTVFDSEFRHYVQQSLFVAPEDLGKLLRLSLDSVLASNETVSKGLAGEMKAWSQKRHPNCYLCGMRLNFQTKNEDDSYTLDHIWPRSFGGHSDVGNLLPACWQCNNRHKQSFATWAAIAVQSLVLGLMPMHSSLRRIQGSHRFAIHHKIVQETAIKNRLSLKDAYLRVGPSAEISVRRE